MKKSILSFLLVLVIPTLLSASQKDSTATRNASFSVRLGRGIEYCGYNFVGYQELGRTCLMLEYRKGIFLLGAGLDRRDPVDGNNGFAGHLRGGLTIPGKKVNIDAFLDIEKCFGLPEAVRPLAGVGLNLSWHCLRFLSIYGEFCAQASLFGRSSCMGYGYYYYQSPFMGYAHIGIGFDF